MLKLRATDIRDNNGLRRGITATGCSIAHDQINDMGAGGIKRNLVVWKRPNQKGHAIGIPFIG